ncbi:AT-hook motif nuclear-localized protein 14 [Cornus florida]|uniref:AT-hook motif nuclear-localized protein 14 n=1 Tax=Cornus florida TaxID=4283 RepID=UPI00289B1C48|nr:AT-hook motif nuclear-localized protein 14 [Cornus florida]
MEPNESGLSSYYHQQHHPPQPPHPQHLQIPATATTASAATTAAATSPTNGILPNTDRAPHMVYPHSVPSAVSTPLEIGRRKRGRPRKYGTPEQAAAAKRLSSSSASLSSMPISPPKKKDQSFGAGGGASSSSSKKTQLAALGNAGQGFIPHIIAVAAGEDVSQKIMVFMQQSKREICILSASGSISNPSLRQPATSGGNITYEGVFDILTLSGSYVRTELGGRTGGLSVCLSNPDGQIIGGGVGGPMKAAGPVQVIVGTFVIDNKKDMTAGVKGDASASKFPSPVGGTSVSSVSFQSAVDSGRIPLRGNADDQSMGGGQYIMQPRTMAVTPSQSIDWRGSGGTDGRGNASYELAGRTNHGVHESPENGDY